jgi:hypothetical protein
MSNFPGFSGKLLGIGCATIVCGDTDDPLHGPRLAAFGVNDFVDELRHR